MNVERHSAALRRSANVALINLSFRLQVPLRIPLLANRTPSDAPLRLRFRVNDGNSIAIRRYPLVVSATLTSSIRNQINL